MGFSDYGDLESFLRIQATFPDSRRSRLRGRKRKKEEQTTVMVGENAISNWPAVFGAPEIMAGGKDPRFIGKVFHGFCTARNIVLQTVIPGHRQSLGATERRHGFFDQLLIV